MIKRFLVLVGVVAGGLLGWLALRGISWGEVLTALGQIHWHVLVLALSAVVFAGVMETCRWKLLLPQEKVSIVSLFFARNVGQGMNTISPLSLVRDVTQTAKLIRFAGIGASKAVSSILLGRLFDLVVTVNLVAAGVFLLPQLSGFKPIVLPLWGISAVAFIAFLLLGNRMHKLSASTRLRPLVEILQFMGQVRQHKKVLLMCFALTSISWMSIGAAAWLVAQAAGVDLPFWLVSMVIVAVGSFAGAIPAPPGTVGVYEFVAVYTLGLFAIAPSVALTFALVIHAVLFLPPILIGVAALALHRGTRRAVPASA